jgi:hypothetical protein
MSPRLVLFLACLAFASPALAEPGVPQMIITQGMMYVLPEGWRLVGYRPDKAAILKHEVSGTQMLISRPTKATTAPPPAHVERTGNGRTLRWDYRADTMDGRLFAGAVEIRVTIIAPDLSRVPVELGVPAMRRLAETAIVTGPLVEPPPAKPGAKPAKKVGGAVFKPLSPMR